MVYIAEIYPKINVMSVSIRIIIVLNLEIRFIIRFNCTAISLSQFRKLQRIKYLGYAQEDGEL